MKKCIGLISANYSIDGISPLDKERALASLPFGGRYRLIDFPLSNLANGGVMTTAIIIPINNRSLVEHVGVGKDWGFGHKSGGLFLLPGTVFGERIKSSRFIVRDVVRNMNFLTKDSAEYVIFFGSSKIYNIDVKELIDYMDKSNANITLVYKKMLLDKNSGNLFLQISKDGKVEGIKQKCAGVANCFLDCAIMKREFLLKLLEWYGVLEDMDIIEVLGDHIDKFEINSYEFKGYVGDIYDGNQYFRASMDLLDYDIRTELFNTERTIYTNIQDRPPTKYGPKAVVKNSLIAGGCIIEGTVENSIIFRNSEVKAGAVVKNSILLQHCVVHKDALVERVVFDKNVQISEAVHIAGGIDKPFIAEKGKSL